MVTEPKNQNILMPALSWALRLHELELGCLIFSPKIILPKPDSSLNQNLTGVNGEKGERSWEGGPLGKAHPPHPGKPLCTLNLVLGAR